MTDISRICRRMAVTAVLLPVFAWAGTGTGTWTGAEDGFWTNANNWAEKSVPGFTATDTALLTTEASLRLASSALFDGANLTGAKVTTINLDGLADIAYVRFTGDTQFTLGTDLDQYLPIEVGGAMAVLGSKAPIIQATLMKLACGYYTYWNTGGNPKPGISITNNAPETLVIPGYDKYSGTNPQEARLTIAGTGVIRMTGTVSTTPAIHLYLAFATGGRLVIDTVVGVREIVLDTVLAHKIEITENGQLYPFVPTYGYFNISKGSLDISGAGELAFGGGRYTSKEEPARWNNTPEDIRVPLTVSTHVTSFYLYSARPKDWYPAYTVGNDAKGSIEFTSDQNFATGEVEIVCGTLKTAQIGLANTDGTYTHASRIGFGPISLTGSGRLQYLGAGETSDKVLSITNAIRAFTDTPKSYDPIGVVEQAGTGTLTMASPVKVLCPSGTLVLDSSVAAPAVWSGVLQNTADDQVLGLEKRGTGTWTLSAVNTYTGPTTLKGGTLALAAGASIAASSALDFAGGTLEIPAYATDTAAPIPAAVTVSSGASTLIVGAHAQLAFALTRTSGTLDIRLEKMPASVKVTGLSEGDAPAYLTINGQAATVAADGTLAPIGTAYWKAAVSGVWSAAANWWPDMPAAGSSSRRVRTARAATSAWNCLKTGG